MMQNDGSTDKIVYVKLPDGLDVKARNNNTHPPPNKKVVIFRMFFF